MRDPTNRRVYYAIDCEAVVCANRPLSTAEVCETTTSRCGLLASFTDAFSGSFGAVPIPAEVGEASPQQHGRLAGFIIEFTTGWIGPRTRLGAMSVRPSIIAVRM